MADVAPLISSPSLYHLYSYGSVPLLATASSVAVVPTQIVWFAMSATDRASYTFTVTSLLPPCSGQAASATCTV